MSKPKISPGYIWAKRNLLNSPSAQAAWQFQERLEQSQWHSRAQHEARQAHLLTALLLHAANTVPFYRDHLSGLDLTRPLTAGVFPTIPILTRRDLQENGVDIRSTNLPAAHGRTVVTSSSGSTAQPISVLHSEISAGWHRALTLRSQLWALGRFDRKLGAIRRYTSGTADYPDGLASVRWTDDATLPFLTGPASSLTVVTPLHHQVEWLLRTKPQILVTFPTNLNALCQFAESRNTRLPRMRKILTLGEAMPEGMRGAAKRTFGAEVADTYSAAEVGEIAIQCPQGTAYHIQSESLLVEVLDDKGEPCAPGETGRIVITALHNFATPLIRYEIGDLATVGKPCACGRGLPVLSRILGRHRNMMVARDGSRFWPSFGLKSSWRVAPIIQGQYVQHTINDLEVILVTKRPLSDEEETRIKGFILERMPNPIDIRFTYRDEIRRGASGKFEEFTCKVDSR